MRVLPPRGHGEHPAEWPHPLAPFMLQGLPISQLVDGYELIATALQIEDFIPANPYAMEFSLRTIDLLLWRRGYVEPKPLLYDFEIYQPRGRWAEFYDNGRFSWDEARVIDQIPIIAEEPVYGVRSMRRYWPGRYDVPHPSRHRPRRDRDRRERCPNLNRNRYREEDYDEKDGDDYGDRFYGENDNWGERNSRHGPRKNAPYSHSNQPRSGAPPRSSTNTNRSGSIKATQQAPSPPHRSSKPHHADSSDLYIRLQLDSSATTDEILNAYKKLALIYHPDKNTTAPPEDKADKEDKFKKIIEAIEWLRDPNKRKFYDTFGRTDEPGYNEWRNQGMPCKREWKGGVQGYNPCAGGGFSGAGFGGGGDERPGGRRWGAKGEYEDENEFGRGPRRGERPGFGRNRG